MSHKFYGSRDHEIAQDKKINAAAKHEHAEDASRVKDEAAQDATLKTFDSRVHELETHPGTPADLKDLTARVTKLENAPADDDTAIEARITALEALPPGSGPKGDKGDTGNQGDKGDTGSQGEPGTPGVPGTPGDPGIPGVPGSDGKNGLDGLNGRDGVDGLPGTNGANGLDGRPGVDGRIGSDGQKGDKGDKGDSGAPGADVQFVTDLAARVTVLEGILLPTSQFVTNETLQRAIDDRTRTVAMEVATLNKRITELTVKAGPVK